MHGNYQELIEWAQFLWPELLVIPAFAVVWFVMRRKHEELRRNVTN
jgi:hypothetical protein